IRSSLNAPRLTRYDACIGGGNETRQIRRQISRVARPEGRETAQYAGDQATSRFAQNQGNEQRAASPRT
ncbi:MAG: hypothetical protein WCB69_21640, partial [Pseudolabrys sp.]